MTEATTPGTKPGAFPHKQHAKGLQGEQRVDVCIVGGRFLLVYRRFSSIGQSGQNSALLEAERPGLGVSGRNGGADSIPAGRPTTPLRWEKTTGAVDWCPGPFGSSAWRVSNLRAAGEGLRNRLRAQNRVFCWAQLNHGIIPELHGLQASLGKIGYDQN